MDLLTFFVFPIAIIIFSIALQRLLRSPILVAAVVFAAFLIVAFTAFDETFLIAVLVYTLIALITAFIACILGRSNENENSTCENSSDILSNMTDNNSNNGDNTGCRM